MLLLAALCRGNSVHVPHVAAEQIRSFDPKKKVVVLVHGMGSCALESKIHKAAHLGAHHKHFKHAFVDMQHLAEDEKNLEVMVKSLSVERFLDVADSVHGVHVRPVAGLAGIRSLNPEGSEPIPAFENLIDALSADFNLLCFNYDWRRWGGPDFSDYLCDEFRGTVHGAVMFNGQPVDVVAHSMGAAVAHLCMSEFGPEWQKNNINQCVWISPVHGGSASLLPSWASGFRADRSDVFPAPELLTKDISKMTASWPCLVAMCPQTHVGSRCCQAENHVFAKTPTKKYTLGEIGKYLEDVSGCVQGRVNGPGFLPDVKGIWAKLEVPAVPLRILYSTGIRTMSQMKYTTEDLSAWPEVWSRENGDGTMLASTVEMIARNWQEESPELDIQMFTETLGVSHRNMVSCTFTCNLVPQILTGVAKPGRHITENSGSRNWLW